MEKLKVMPILGRFYFLVLFILLFLDCQKPIKQSCYSSLTPIGFDLISHAVDTILDQNRFPVWRAEVIVSNNTNDTIWIYQSTNIDKDILICRVKGYDIQNGAFEPIRYSVHSPVGNYAPLLSKHSKVFTIAFPFEGKWACPDESYIEVLPVFLTSPSARNLIKPIWGDTLEKNTVYLPVFSYHIDKNGTRIRCVEENIDSLYKYKRLR